MTFTNFEDWFKANLSDYIEDIASHGADCGYPFITYTADAVEIFNQFEDEIWDMAVEDATDLGYKNVAAMVADFKRSDRLESFDNFKTLLVWYACERLANSLLNC
ncbi:MAG: DUF7222 domain-containing protein [Waterburya sp.]